MVQTPTRRVSVTPHKRERESSLTIGTSADIDPYERIAVLEAKLAEKDQETKDLEVKLFESSFLPSASKSGKIFDEDAPLPSAKKNPARTLFDEEPLPTSRSADISSQNIANRHKVRVAHHVVRPFQCNVIGILHILWLCLYSTRPEEEWQTVEQHLNLSARKCQQSPQSGWSRCVRDDRPQESLCVGSNTPDQRGGDGQAQSGAGLTGADSG